MIFQIFSLHLEVRTIPLLLYTRRRALPLLQSHTSQPSEGEPLLYLLLRYRPALSPAAAILEQRVPPSCGGNISHRRCQFVALSQRNAEEE